MRIMEMFPHLKKKEKIMLKETSLISVALYVQSVIPVQCTAHCRL
jgi:hypothetical protein